MVAGNERIGVGEERPGKDPLRTSLSGALIREELHGCQRCSPLGRLRVALH